MTQPGAEGAETAEVGPNTYIPGVNELIDLVTTEDGDPDDPLRCTDTGNALRFRALYREVARWLTDTERWILWNGERWELDVPGDRKALALTLGVVRLIRDEALAASDEPGPNNSPSPRDRLLKHATNTESIGKRESLLKAASALLELHATLAEFDADRRVLACRGQVVELRDHPPGVLRPKTPDPGRYVRVRPLTRADMLRFGTRASYRPEVLEKPPPLVLNYLETFVPDPVRQKMLFKALGACLIGSNEHRLFIIIQGESTTGKTQLAEGIFEALGPDYATIGTASVFRGNLDDKPRPDILRAVRRRVAFFSEASKAWELHGDRVKDLTGGGTVSARGMRTNDFDEERPLFTPVLVTNAVPKIIGPDPALLRRMLLFDFTHRPLEEDPTIRDRFVHDSEVHDWLLARLVRGYAESVAEGLGDVLVAQGLATMEAFENLTHLGSFFRWLTDTDQLSTVPDEEREAYGVKSTYVTLKEMYDRYAYWVREYGGKRDQSEKLDYESFNDQLVNNGWTKKKSGTHRWEGKRLVSLVHLHGFAGL